MSDPTPATPPHDQNHLAALLRDGIAAVKAGRLAQARSLLMQVVERDEANEKAWLWLSGAVESDDDRRICLENVLTLNPNNAAAQRGLSRLGPARVEAEAKTDSEEIVMRRGHAPISPAAAILYPDRQVHEWRWRKTPDLKQVPAVEHQAHSTFDDVWNSAKDICGYCAHEVSDDDRQCPRCRRQLAFVHFRRAQPGANLYYLGVLTLSLGLQQAVQVFLDAMLAVEATLLALDVGLATALLILAAGVYLRRRWAYRAATIVMAAVLLISMFRAAQGFSSTSNLLTLVAVVVQAAQVITSLLGLIIGVLRAGEDFAVVEARHVMQLGEGLNLTGDHFHTGKQYAERGMWAMAIPYFQRAAAAEPTRAFFQQMLGEAFARLGFHDRSLNVLEAAHRLAVDPKQQDDIEQLMQDVRQRQSQEAETSQKE